MTKGNEYFKVTHTKVGVNTITTRTIAIAQKAKPPKFIIECKSLATPHAVWKPALDAFSLTQSEAYRKLQACVNSPLKSYWRCTFQVRRLKDDRIMREQNHKSCH